MGPNYTAVTIRGGPRVIVMFDDRGGMRVAKPVEPGRFVVQRSPWGRLGSVLVVGNRLRRMRRRFQLQIHLPRCISGQLAQAQSAKH